MNIKISVSFVFSILLSLLLAVAAFADDFIASDVKGIKDIPNIKRIEGSVLVMGEQRAFDEFTASLGKIEFDYNAQDYKPWQKLKVEGSHAVAFYRMPKDVTTLEPSRSYEVELGTQGFEVLFKGSGEELDNGYGRFVSQLYGKNIGGSLMEYVFPSASDFRYLALKKSNDDGSQSIFTGLFAKVPDSWASKYAKAGDVIARIDFVQTKPLTKRLVLVKAEELDQQISSNGRVALYGIQFDFNKADIKSESEPTLVEISKYLEKNPSVKLLVAGHTDNVGGFEFNRDLSDRRAKSVVDYLVSKFKISRERLFPFGVSYASPIASNATEDGKAKNRRVELVQY